MHQQCGSKRATWQIWFRRADGMNNIVKNTVIYPPSYYWLFSHHHHPPPSFPTYTHFYEDHGSRFTGSSYLGITPMASQVHGGKTGIETSGYIKLHSRLPPTRFPYTSASPFPTTISWSAPLPPLPWDKERSNFKQ